MLRLAYNRLRENSETRDCSVSAFQLLFARYSGNNCEDAKLPLQPASLLTHRDKPGLGRGGYKLRQSFL